MGKLSLSKAEVFLFYVVVLGFASPLLFQSFFPTNDGPAHLYNSNLIGHYLSNSRVVNRLFEFNSYIEPNWIGHFLLILLKGICSGPLAEKAMAALCMILLPLSLRSLIRTFNPENAYLAWLSIPFGYNFMLLLGFYNFCLGVAFLLFALSFLVRNKYVFEGKKLVFLFVFGFLLYFSHLIVFGIFLCTLGAGVFFTSPDRTKALARAMAVQLPFIFLSLIFIFNKSGVSDPVSLDKQQLLDWLLEARPLILFNESNEKWFGWLVNTALLVMVVPAFFDRAVWQRAGESRFNLLLLASFTVVWLLLFFIFPDGIATGGFISVRLLFLFYLFFFCALSYFHLPKFISITCICLVMIPALYQQLYKFKESRELSEQAGTYASVSSQIEEFAVVLPLNYSGNWLHSNFSNYMGSDKLLLILDNYEASTPHFPLKWKSGKEPYDVIGTFGNSLNPDLQLARFEKQSGVRVDYITRWYYDRKTTDSVNIATNAAILRDFDPVYESGDKRVELFKRKAAGKVK